jgi:hypothetical protein
LRLATPANGSRAKRRGRITPATVRHIKIQFDDETFDTVRERAVKARTSFAEQVRLLVEIGLEMELAIE